VKGSLSAILRALVLPFGAITGPRIVLDGVSGEITAYGQTDTDFAKIDPDNAGAVTIGVNASDGSSAVMESEPTGTRLIVEAGSGARAGITAGTGSSDFFMEVAPPGGGVTVTDADIGITEDGTADHRPTMHINSAYVDNGSGVKASIQLKGTGVTTTTTSIDLDADQVTLSDGGASLNLGAYQTYTPTWTGSGGNPALGNGSVSARYQYLNSHTIRLTVRFSLGTTTTKGTGTYTFSLPVAPSNANGNGATGAGWINDSGTAIRTATAIIAVSAVQMWIDGSPSHQMANTDLAGIVGSTTFQFSIDYEV
jgi:hypothetical protein